MSKKIFTWPSTATISTAGLATSAKQDTGNTSLASIDGKLVNTANGTKVDVQASVLPTGAATAANQTTANTSLGSIDTKLSSQATAANQATANTSLASIDGKLASTVNGTKVDVQASVLPTGAATAANQTTANTSLSSIDTKLSSQATAANQSTANTSLASIDTKLSSQATAANQSTANTSLSSIDGKLTGVATAANQSTANTSLSSIDTKLSLKTALAKARIDYTGTNVTTAAYTTLIASVGSTAIKEIEIFDSSGQTLVLATGAAASEVDQIYIIPGGNGKVSLSIAASTRVAIKAVSATASSGEIDVNFYG